MNNKLVSIITYAVNITGLGTAFENGGALKKDYNYYE